MSTTAFREMTESKQKAIPRFASFRPKVQESQGPGQGLKRSASDTDPSILWQEDTKQSVDSDRRDRSHRKHHARKLERPDSEIPPITSRDPHVPPINSSDTFLIDKFGDQKNLIYGSLHRYTVPQYRRIGAGSVIGSYQKIDRSGSDAQIIILSDPAQKDTLGIVSLTSWKPSKHHLEESVFWRGPSKNLGPIEITLDYLPLDTIPLQRSPQALNETESSDDGLETQEPANSTKPDELEEKRKEKANLWDNAWNKRADLEAWLVYIDWLEAHQSTVLIASELAINTHTIISSYEEALEYVRNEKSKEHLIVRMMKHGRSIWVEKEILGRWQRYAQEYPSSQALWQNYVNCHQTASDFHFEDLLTLYKSRLISLQTKRHDTEADLSHCGDELRRKQLHSSRASTCVKQVQTLLRLTLMLRDAGYIERGIATWQAVLELNFYCPPGFGHLRNANAQDEEDILASLEYFWESGVSRIGEEGARGWCEFIASGQPTWRPQKDAVDATAELSTTWKSWLKFENSAASLDVMPARYEDEINEDDNARIIMFSDLKEALFTVPQEGLKVLLNAFLAFCHLPPLGESCQQEDPVALEVDHGSYSTPFLQGQLLEKPSGSLARISSRPVTESQLLEYRRTPEMYLDPQDWIDPFSILDKTDSDLQIKHFAGRVLARLVSCGRNLAKILGTYYIGLASRLSPNTVEKTARALFKRHKSDFELSDVFCNAYAHILARLGRWAAARSVFETALKVGDRTGAQRGPRQIQHLHALVSGSLERNHISDARKILDEEYRYLPTTAGDLNAIQEGQLHSLVMLEKYIQQPHRNMQAAADAHGAYESTVLPEFLCSMTLEISHQYKAKLLYHDAVHPPSSLPPIRMRDQLALSITRFPHNTVFQTLYMWNERRCGAGVSLVANAVLHSPYSTSNSEDESVAPHIVAIHNVVSQTSWIDSLDSANTNSIRNVFERAVTSPAGCCCPDIWYWYLMWEFSLATALSSSSTFPPSTEGIKKQSSEKSRRRAIWWRAISACPWVKSIHMLAFEEGFAEAMGMDGRDEGLMGVFEIMERRELRVRMRRVLPAKI